MNKSILLNTLSEFKKINAIKYGILSLGIFGSYARAQNTDTSDIDIVIKTETPDLFNVVHIKEDLEEQLKMSVDIVRMRDNMNPYLKKRIEKEAVYV